MATATLPLPPVSPPALPNPYPERVLSTGMPPPSTPPPVYGTADPDIKAQDARMRSLVRFPTNLLGFPVDLANAALGALNWAGGGGSPIRATKTPVGGSQWLANQVHRAIPAYPTESGDPNLDFLLGLTGPGLIGATIRGAQSVGRAVGRDINALADWHTARQRAGQEARYNKLFTPEEQAMHRAQANAEVDAFMEKTKNDAMASFKEESAAAQKELDRLLAESDKLRAAAGLPKVPREPGVPLQTASEKLPPIAPAPAPAPAPTEYLPPINPHVQLHMHSQLKDFPEPTAHNSIEFIRQQMHDRGILPPGIKPPWKTRTVPTPETLTKWSHVPVGYPEMSWEGVGLAPDTPKTVKAAQDTLKQVKEAGPIEWENLPFSYEQMMHPDLHPLLKTWRDHLMITEEVAALERKHAFKTLMDNLQQSKTGGK